MGKIFVVDDEEIMRDLVADTLQMAGYQIRVFSEANSAIRALSTEIPDLVVSDFKMPGATGVDLLLEVKKVSPGSGFILMTAYGTVGMAVEALRSGADTILEKPFEPEFLEHQVRLVLESHRMRRENADLRAQLQHSHKFIGNGDRYRKLLHFVEEVAPTNSTVLITGESGVGKEVLARAIHGQSRRSASPFIKVNCAALPESLIESELFGHEKGSFTGALRTRKGKFEQAHGGTLLLDEIGEMPLSAQSKLLRVLQERELSRIGSDEEIRVDVRVICTTNRDLLKDIRESKFREDLYYRLSVVPIHISPLRERPEDIQILVRYFMEKVNSENGWTVEDITDQALQQLQKLQWPGNIRQLENAVERAMVFRKTGILGESDFDLEGMSTNKVQTNSSEAMLLQSGMTIAQAEQMLILRTLEDCGGNRTRASELLDISIRTLRNKLHEYGQMGE